jgi:hypothetical protein
VIGLVNPITDKSKYLLGLSPGINLENLVILLRKLKKCYITWKFGKKFVLWTHKINQEMETFYFDDLGVAGSSEL